MQKLGLLAVLAAAVAAVPAPANAQNVVTCESYGGRRQTCRVDTRSGEVRLVRRLSDASCVRGRSWGVTNGGVWVDDGCRAQFAVYGSRGGNDGRWENDGRRDRDDRHGRGRDDRWERDGRHDRNDRVSASWALNRCRLAVARRVGSNRRVNVWMENNSRNNSRVGWRADRGLRGTCRVDREGRVDVRVDRNR
jgi:hypothetical protein